MKYNLLSETSNDANYELFGKSKLKCFADRKWVLEILLPKIAKWCSEEQNQTESLFVPSLSLINREKYSVLYHNLKKKYGKDISAAWPEVTDPQKYVYEDIAIASYLLLLWEEERTSAGIKKMQSFADLGCGNGLLVHILISEGHQGIGIDIRKRKVWNIYDAKTKLVEGIVDPNDLSIVKQYDWLLGNHSDELTPWIPVMASKCGYNTKFWVLPCCFFDFYGKYERMQSSSGQYIDYLKFVKSIGFQCGFDIKEDVMRIPSTKRVCFVGKSKTYKEFEHESTIKAIDKFINERKDSLASNKFAKGFQARPKEEKVRNCTKISREIQFSIVKSISSHLLSEYNPIMSDSGKPWNRGGKLVLGKAIEILSESSRLQLKKECGGLQTFLRNNHQIFEVRSGAVQIRDWTTPEQHPISKKRKKGNKADTWKTKDCWFHNNHPDGCPRSSDACPFLHQ